MKKIVLALCFVSLVTIHSNAQTTTSPAPSSSRDQKERKQVSPEDRAKKDAERATKNLNLTPDQKAKWETAALEKARANEPLKAKLDGATTPDERKAVKNEMKVNKDKFDTSVSAFLSPEQKAKYEQMKKEHEDHDHGHKKGNP